MRTEKNKMRILAGLNESEKVAFPIIDSYSIIEIINKYDYLKKAFKYIVLNNKSNNAPYHNLNHLLTVTKAVYDAMQYESNFKMIDKNGNLKEMLLASIFHDFNHSAGKETDDKNIIEAKKGIKKFLEEEKIKVDINFINLVLDATQFPYVIKKEDLNIYQAIIRDADLAQIFKYNWIQQNILGLSQELKMSFVDFLKPQKKFLENVEFNTSWGKELKKTHWKQVMKEFEILENMF